MQSRILQGRILKAKRGPMKLALVNPLWLSDKPTDLLRSFANPASFQLAIATDHVPDLDSIDDSRDSRRAMSQRLNLLLQIEARQAPTQPQNAIVKL